MTNRRAICAFLLLLLLPAGAYCMLKQQYGGNIKIAEDLLTELGSQPLFRFENNSLLPASPLTFERKEASIRIDLKPLDQDQLTDIEKWISALNDQSNTCHWILDYPYYDHQHPTTITVEGTTLAITSSDSEYLDTILQSRCLLPPDLKSFSPFNHTQFGYEANLNDLSGRPFLDSISPVEVDSVNPYLSFKLNDVDVAIIPEDRFTQISTDGSLSVIPGPSFYVYLVTSGLTSEQIEAFLAAIGLKEIARAVLNDHAEILLRQPQTDSKSSTKLPAIYFSYPQENPYRLLAERLRVQWENKGIQFLSQAASHTPQITLAVAPIQEQSQDAFRYHLLGNHLASHSNEAWFDQWEKLESSGTVIPFLIHHSYIAARKNIQDLHTDSEGIPDFADCWLFQ